MEVSKLGFESNDEMLHRLRDEFVPRQCAVIRNFLSPSLGQQVSKELECAEFDVYTTYRPDGKILDTEMKISGSNVWVHALHLLLNDQRLFDAIEFVTGCSKIASFQGRISRHAPNCDHHSDWHDDRDLEKARLVGISINLSARPYCGGQFEIRRKGHAEALAKVSHSTAGAAHIFTINDALQHRVAAVHGDFPRTALAGWFRSTPDRWTIIGEQYSPSAQLAKSAVLLSTDTSTPKPIEGTLMVPDFVLAQSVGDSIVLLNMKTRKYYALHTFAAEFWKLLSRGRTLCEAVAQLSNKHGREKQARKSDLEALAARLVELELLAFCN